MISICGTAEEVADVIQGIAPGYPDQVIRNLKPGEYHFSVNGIDLLLIIMTD